MLYSWYFKRIKRIYIPYELFVVILAVITLLRGGNIFTINWFLLVLDCKDQLLEYMERNKHGL